MHSVSQVVAAAAINPAHACTSLLNVPRSSTRLAHHQQRIQHSVEQWCANTLATHAYQHQKVPQWTQSVVEGVLKDLTSEAAAKRSSANVDTHRQYKYIVNCVIMQKPSLSYHLTGMHAASSCYWDVATDGCFTYRYETKSLYAIVNVFAVATI